MRNVLAATAMIAVTTLAIPLAGADITLPSGLAVAPGEFVSMPVTLGTPAPSGGVFVSLTSSDTSKVTINPASVYIPTGATTPYAQPQVNGVSFGVANISASAYGLTGDTETVRVAATLFGPAATTLARGSTQNITFTLSSPTPAALAVKISSDMPGVASVPASVTIPAQGTAAVVPITGVGAGSAIIRVSSPPSIAERLLTATVVAAGSITVSSVTAPLGRTVPFPVTLGSPAPNGGVFLSLASSNKAVVAVSPSSLFIAGGSTTPASQPQVTGVNIGAATISVSATGYATASQTVPVPATITVSPATLTIPQPGTTGKLLLALSDSAPWGPDSSPWAHGLTVQLSSSNPSVATVQPTADFYPDGSSFTTVVVVVTAVRPGMAIIKASAPPFIPETTAVVNVLP